MIGRSLALWPQWQCHPFPSLRSRRSKGSKVRWLAVVDVNAPANNNNNNERLSSEVLYDLCVSCGGW